MRDSSTSHELLGSPQAPEPDYEDALIIMVSTRSFKLLCVLSLFAGAIAAEHAPREPVSGVVRANSLDGVSLECVLYARVLPSSQSRILFLFSKCPIDLLLLMSRRTPTSGTP